MQRLGPEGCDTKNIVKHSNCTAWTEKKINEKSFGQSVGEEKTVRGKAEPKAIGRIIFRLKSREHNFEETSRCPEHPKTRINKQKRGGGERSDEKM